jgi:uncharacterized protein involved in exopolysaccharide biosynthesis
MAEEQNINNEEISLKELIFKVKEWFQYLLSKWKTILLAGILGGILGFTYAYFKKPIYTAETTFVLEEGGSSGGLGQYAGLASMAGIDLGGGGSGIFQGDNILQLYKSRRMIQQALLSKDTFNNKVQSLINRFIQFNQLKEQWETKPHLEKLSFDNDPNTFNRIQDSVISSMVEDINKNYLQVAKPDKKLSIINVKVTAKDELFAQSFTKAIVATVNNFYIVTKTKKATENLTILQQQADSVKQVLNYSIGGVAAAIDENPNSNPAFQRLRVSSQKKQVDVQASGAIYQEIVKNLEMAKITLRKEKPLIQVVDEPVLPLKKDRLGKVKGLFVGGIILSFLTTIFLVLRLLLKNILI